MDFEFSPADEVYRQRVRRWLANNHPGTPPGSHGSPAWLHWAKDWQRRAYEAGYIGLGWPKEYGGVESTLTQQVIVTQEMVRARVSHFVGQSGLCMLGPTLLRHGNEAQKKRYLLPILTAEEIWCQGYSEPNAGSDLAGIQTRAVVEGDSFVVNGQKVWTSLAQRSDWQVLLVRTDPEAPKHKGISYLLVDMHTPGITVRPLVQMTGEAGFNEVFYDNVRVPKENLVGEMNQGWQVSIATLMFERVSGGTRHPVERTINELVELAKQVDFQGVSAQRHPYVRQKLAAFVSDARCLRLSRYRSLTSQLRGKVPGPESSFGKLFATELNLRVAMFADEMLGPYGLLESDSLGSVESGKWTHRTLAARGLTIAAGSSEIQHNIIGERVLKLPKG